MSISSAIYAEYADKKRKEWLAELTEAATDGDWAAIFALIKKMQREGFSE